MRLHTLLLELDECCYSPLVRFTFTVLLQGSFTDKVLTAREAVVLATPWKIIIKLHPASHKPVEKCDTW